MEKLTNNLCLTVTCGVTSAIILSSFSSCFPMTKNYWHYSPKKIENEVYFSNKENTDISGIYTNFSSLTGVVKMSKELLNNLKKLDEIGNLKENWNGYSATTFSKTFIDSLKRNILPLVRQPEIFPIAYGNIQLEYDRDDGGYLEFEISPSNEIECYYEEPNGEYKEYPITDFENLNQEVIKFYEL